MVQGTGDGFVDRHHPQRFKQLRLLSLAIVFLKRDVMKISMLILSLAWSAYGATTARVISPCLCIFPLGFTFSTWLPLV